LHRLWGFQKDYNDKGDREERGCPRRAAEEFGLKHQPVKSTKSSNGDEEGPDRIGRGGVAIR